MLEYISGPFLLFKIKLGNKDFYIAVAYNVNISIGGGKRAIAA